MLSVVEINNKYNISYNYAKMIILESGIKIRKHGYKGNKYIIDKENNIAKIELKQKKQESLWTIVDLDDLERVINFPYTWHSYHKECIGDDYYAMATEHLGYKNNKGEWASRTVYLNAFIMNPDNIPNIKVDHIFHDTLDNRKSNLRVSTQDQNLKNRNSKNKNNKSGYRNVMYLPYRKKTPYHVQLMIEGKNKCLGRFATAEEAGEFAEKMRQKYYGEFAGAS